MIRVLLATPDAELTGRVRTLLGETPDLEVTRVASTALEVTNAVTADDTTLDVVVLHEQLGPLPVLDLARELNHRFPEVGVVLLARDPELELLRSAMSAGVRSVVRLPLTLTDISDAITEANEWSQNVQDRLAVTAANNQERPRQRGRMYAIAGSKGGVGTTTVAVQLALELQQHDPSSSVCLVDLDLQTGDVRSYLDVAHRRSITDLVDVVSELTTNHLNDAMFEHVSGLRVLLPPVDGEDGEELDGAMTARILGGLRSRYDTVVLDIGSVATDASTSGAELADDVVIVCTPDVVSLRGANRLLALWRRIEARDGNVHVLLNRVSRGREIQPRLAARVVGGELLKTALPDEDKAVEQVANTGDPTRLAGKLKDALVAFSHELRDLAEPRTASDSPSDEDVLAKRVVGAESGSVSAEFVGLIVPVFVAFMVVWQGVLAGYTAVAANQAAAEAARIVAVEPATPPAELRAAAAGGMLPLWRSSLEIEPLAPAQVDAGVADITVTLDVPFLLPGRTSAWQVSSSSAVLIEPRASEAPTGAGA